MTPTTRTLTTVVGCTLLVGAVLVAVLSCPVSAPVAAVQHGRFMDREILARSAALCAVTVPDAGPLTIAAEPALHVSPDRAARRSWAVQAVDAASADVSHMNWDADSGALLMVSRRGESSTVRPDRPHTKRHIVEHGLTWVRATAPEGEARWALDGRPQRTAGVWRVQYRSADRRARVTMNAYNGQMSTVEYWPTAQSSADFEAPTASPPPAPGSPPAS